MAWYKVSYKGKTVGTKSAVVAVKTAAAQVAEPIEKAAAVTVSEVAATFGIPITPDQVNKIATNIKKSTYAKPSAAAVAQAVTKPAVAPAPVADSGMSRNTKLGIALFGLLGVWYAIRKAR